MIGLLWLLVSGIALAVEFVQMPCAKLCAVTTGAPVLVELEIGRIDQSLVLEDGD